MKKASNYKVYVFTMSKADAKRVESKHDDLETLQWTPEMSDKDTQVFRVAGEPEIILELAANLDIENVNQIHFQSFPNFPY